MRFLTDEGGYKLPCKFVIHTFQMARRQENQKVVDKVRDLLKMTTMMSDDKASYLILGIENESKIRYAEPVKSGLYDFLRYAAQVRQTEKKHRRRKAYAKHNRNAFRRFGRGALVGARAVTS